MLKRVPAFLVTLLLASAVNAAETPATTLPAELPLARQKAFLSANLPGVVLVEYTLQYDKGEAPMGLSPEGHYATSWDDLSSYLQDERPMIAPGYLLEGNRVLTRDLQIHPRFIKSIQVRPFGSNAEAADTKRVTATVSAHARSQDAVVLALQQPLEGATPLKFNGDTSGPLSILTLDNTNARWAADIDAYSPNVTHIEGKTPVVSVPSGLLLDKEGKPVTLGTGVELPADPAAWRKSPTDWDLLAGDALKTQLAALQQQAAASIIPVTLNFRSPRNNPSTGGMIRHVSSNDEDEATVRHVLGVVTGPNAVLVLADLKPTVTARLERIHLETDPPVDATFAGSLSDYGALLATTEKLLSHVSPMSPANILDLQSQALPAAEIYMQGEQRIAYFQPRRINGFTLGWRSNLFPDLPVHDAARLFLFDADNKLLALPLAHRQKPGADNGSSKDDPRLTPVAHLSKLLASPKDHLDSHNIPLSEADENRLAWIGVELQEMSQELARANNVADQTQDGETGALVSYVYPDSPAAKASVEPGWIFLRVHVEGEPKPIEVKAEGDHFGGESFPWDRLDEASESMFDRIPTPWPPVETPLLRTLTDVGFGKPFTAEFAHDGKIITKNFTVTQGPPSYEAAPRYKFEPLGLTVRDLTFEVRRYLQRKPSDGGVIISKIELGSKASIAGLKPYEVITQVNDQPVASVTDFEKLAKGQSELRLNVKRMTKGRIVKVAVPADAAPSSQPE